MKNDFIMRFNAKLLDNLTPKAALVYCVLADTNRIGNLYSNGKIIGGIDCMCYKYYNGERLADNAITMNYERIMEILNISRTDVRNAIRQLEENGYIVVKREFMPAINVFYFKKDLLMMDYGEGVNE